MDYSTSLSYSVTAFLTIPLNFHDCADVTDRHALAAAYALCGVYRMNLFLFARNRADGAGRDTQSAAYALFRVDDKLNQGETGLRRTFFVFYMRRVFVLEIAKRREHGIGRALPQTAQGAGFDLLAEFLKKRDVLLFSLSGADTLKNLQHPLCADSAEGAFAARFGLRER